MKSAADSGGRGDNGGVGGGGARGGRAQRGRVGKQLIIKLMRDHKHWTREVLTRYRLSPLGPDVESGLVHISALCALAPADAALPDQVAVAMGLVEFDAAALADSSEQAVALMRKCVFPTLC